MHYQVIIIGAGPAGLSVAMHLGKLNQKVLLIERNLKAGKKLLLSGSGQCNFTHDADWEHFATRYGDHGKFLKKAFHMYSSYDVMTFFKKRGLSYEVMPNGKVFPKSMKSSDVLDVLLCECKRNNVDLLFGEKVVSLSVYDGIYTLETESGKRYCADYIVMATGGLSYPSTGSDGSGHILAEALGHTIEPTTPSLTYVTTHEKAFAELSGFAFKEAHIEIFRQQKKIKERVGSVLFTHKGLSGPGILDSSRWIKPGDVLKVNYLYPKTPNEIRSYLAHEVSKAGSMTIGTFLRKMEDTFSKSFISVSCKVAGVDEQTACARLSKQEREALVKVLAECTFNVSGLGGYHIAMATAGGVNLKEVNPTSMESRLHKGLYFVGEVLDIDGDTGGYNIQAAFSTGALCAHHIGKQIEKKKVKKR